MNDETKDPKSCYGCPALLLSSAQKRDMLRNDFGKSPVCSKHGKVIGLKDSSEEDRRNIAMDVAASCKDYGKPKPNVPDWPSMKFDIALPNPEAFLNPGSTTPEMQAIDSCMQCQFRVDSSIAKNTTGIDSDFCSAKGKVILKHRHRQEGKNCTVKKMGPAKQSMTGVTFLPEYEPGYISPHNPKAASLRKKRGPAVDPQEYESDIPVDEEMRNEGIRAWREITDAETGKNVYLPIYERSMFSDEEKSKIPMIGDDEHPEDHVDYGGYVYKTAVLWRHLDETPALWGKSGLGKTEHFRHMAWLMGLPFERFSITGSTELDDLAGKMHFIEGTGTKFEYGRLPKAWMKPNVIVIDEPNTGPPDVWQFLRPLTDNSKQLVLDMNSGERIDRADACYLGMAMNPAWDMLNVGAQMIGDADANRLMHIQFELPPKEIEMDIIRKRCRHDDFQITAKQLGTIMDIARDIRALADEGTVPMTWGVRPQIKVARALKWFSWTDAYRMAAADYLEPKQQEQILDAVRTRLS